MYKKAEIERVMFKEFAQSLMKKIEEEDDDYGRDVIKTLQGRTANPKRGAKREM